MALSSQAGWVRRDAEMRTGGRLGDGWSRFCLLAEEAGKQQMERRRQEAAPNDLTQTLLSAAIATWRDSQLSWVPK